MFATGPFDRPIEDGVGLVSAPDKACFVMFDIFHYVSLLLAQSIRRLMMTLFTSLPLVTFVVPDPRR